MTTTTYLWDTLSDNLLSEDDGLGTTTYTNEPTEFGDLVSQNKDINTNFYHFDARGDTRELTDASAVVTDTKLYDAWGNVISSSGSTMMPFQFGGRLGYYSPAGNSSTYIRARWYDGKTAHWFSQDPIAFLDALTLYAYGNNDPIGKIDPSGLRVVQGPPATMASWIAGGDKKPLPTLRLRVSGKATGCDKLSVTVAPIVTVTKDFIRKYGTVINGAARLDLILEQKIDEEIADFGCCGDSNNCSKGSGPATEAKWTLHERFDLLGAFKAGNGVYTITGGEGFTTDKHNQIYPNGDCSEKWCGKHSGSVDMRIFKKGRFDFTNLGPKGIGIINNGAPPKSNAQTPLGLVSGRFIDGVRFDRPAIAQATYSYVFSSCCCDADFQAGVIAIINNNPRPDAK